MFTDTLTAFTGPAPLDDERGCCPRDVDSQDAADKSGSRRRRLWELDPQAHCPVIGVCLPIAALRRLFRKHVVAEASSDDYQLHCDAMAECKRRTPLADALQREFERRYALPIRRAAESKSTEHLTAWWAEASRGPDLAGAVWATVSHPRCTLALQHRLLGEVHMHQHQAGAANRVDHARFEATLAELAECRRGIAALQERLQRQAAEHSQERAHDHERLRSLRAELFKREAVVAAFRGEHGRIHPASNPPDDGGRAAARLQRLRERIAELEQALVSARTETRRPPVAEAFDVDDTVSAAAKAARVQVGTTAVDRALDDRSVLCVGGRPASVPLYRRIVERTGGRFLHHDGGDEQNVVRLDATLAAADLVICQTGCISHDAYWRVKDHCKRTGKPCVFVENSGSTSLKRALAEIEIRGDSKAFES